MLKTANSRGFKPSYVLFDSWYSSLDNLKIIRGYGWHFFTRLKSNRLVDPDGNGNMPISNIEIPPGGSAPQWIWHGIGISYTLQGRRMLMVLA